MSLADDMLVEQLPEGWEKKKLSKIILNFKRGPFGSAIKKEFFVVNGYKVYEQRNAIYKSSSIGSYYINDHKFTELKAFEVLPRDFIVSCSGTIGRIYQIPEHAPEGVINQALLRLRIDYNIVDETFFYFLFESDFFQSHIIKSSKGVAIKNMASVKEMKEVEVPIPPLPVQQQIVSKIEQLFSELDSAILLLHQLKQKMKLYRQSILKAAFLGKLTGSYVEGDVLPEGWVVEPLDKLCIIERGSSPRPIEKYITNGVGVNWIKIGDTKYHTKYLYNTKEKITFDGAKKSRYVRVGDLIISNSMSFGKPYIMKIDGYIHDGWFVLRLNQDVDTEYLYYSFMSPTVNAQINILATGSVVKNIRSDLLKVVMIILPPLPVQQQIVSKIEQLFSVCDELEITIDSNIKKSELLKQSILKHAFSGKLI